VSGDEVRDRRLILPDSLPDAARVRRILELAGWQVVKTGDDARRAVWDAPPGAEGEIGIFPVHLGDPDRVAGLRLDPGEDGRLGRSLPRYLDEEATDDAALLGRARDAVERMRHAGLVTDPVAPAPCAAPPAPGYALVLDEPATAARKNDIQELLFLAREENPGARILVRTGAAGGQLGGGELPDDAETVPADTLVHDLLEGAVAVYTVGAALGFDAIFAGHRPCVLGEPFYAGRGLTDDRGPITRRRRPLTRAQLFAAAIIATPLWYDPHRDRLCGIEDAISAEAALARAAREDARGYVASGMRLWKRAHVRAALGGDVRFAGPSRAAALAGRTGRRRLVWGSAPADTPVLRMEDGFLRSRGLGARLVPPLSLTLDDLGIYYDPASESRLERLIAASGALPAAEIRRAEELMGSIRRSGLSKYNIGGNPEAAIPEDAVLVPGQVEDDASILLGAVGVRTNLDFLRLVRSENPDRTILYKPHPDVEAGLRAGRVPDDDALNYADIVLQGADPAALLERVAEVWTITSLIGFEALMRGVQVTCAGLPFYAGWGLTRDLAPAPQRRGARPTLAGLVHAALIGYPRYLDPVSGMPAPPEVIAERLASGEGPRPRPGLLAKLQGLRATVLPR